MATTVATMAFFGLLRAIHACTLDHTAKRHTHNLQKHTDSHCQTQQQEPHPVALRPRFARWDFQKLSRLTGRVARTRGYREILKWKSGSPKKRRRSIST